MYIGFYASHPTCFLIPGPTLTGVDFLAHTTLPARSLALTMAAQQQGVMKTAKELRKLIPVELILRMQIEAAVTGLLPAYDKITGEEVGPAAPVKMETRFELMKFLANKRLPDAKVEQDSGRDFDPTTLPTTLADAMSLTPHELDEAIQATFTPVQETPQCPPPSPTPISKATDGSSSQSTSGQTPSP